MIKMKGFKEFKARMESDEAFREKFRDVKDEEQLLALTRAEGYDVEILDEEDLDVVAGGANAADNFKKVSDTAENEVSNAFNRGVNNIGNAIGNLKKDIVRSTSVPKVVIETAAAKVLQYVRWLF
ncbi:MAG: Nif11-like leader peptide family natural product precursor [Selenomonadaceae bacterium]|nr:Nif11-like leader peptide family natural product precursor [Selenomonadaceae bacterium]